MRIKKGWKITFLIIGAYIAYFITGIILVATNVVEEWLIAPNTVFTDRGGDSHGNAPMGADGPHIFYVDSTIIVKAVVRGDTGFVGRIDTFYHRDSILVQCRFDDHPEWNFSTRLKDTLAIDTCIYSTADSLLAISDIEGEFGAFRKLLIANHVIDEQYNWIFGTGHLVLAGDFFDRGTQVTETLWLIYNLEGKAAAEGGKVHFVLGNHEIMNLQGDIRYVSNKYIQNTYLIKANYKTWFTQDTELGRWLGTKNVIERVDNMLFVHGGISEEVNSMNLSLPEINKTSRPYYFVPKEQRDSLLTPKVRDLLIASISPLWYRGYAQDDAEIEQVDKTRSLYGVDKIVVGHTVVDHVSYLYGERVIDIDTKHSKGISEGMLCIGKQYYRVDTTGKRYNIIQL